jgi:amino acid permease
MLIDFLLNVVLLGDTFSQIARRFFGNVDITMARQFAIYFFTIFVILPLCLLKRLDALKYSSILGLSGTVYSVAFIIYRYLDGSYFSASMPFVNELKEPLRPLFGNTLLVWYLTLKRYGVT